MSELCLCGSREFENEVRTGFVTSGTGESLPKEVPVAVCCKCGLIRQRNLPFSNEKEYDLYYESKYPPISQDYFVKDYGKDLELARKRLVAYGENKYGPLLDVGSGSGAFIDVCRGSGIEAFGCELGEYHYSRAKRFTYKGKLEGIHFPTDHFRVVTCHDVVEHVLDPTRFLSEIFRVMDQGGEGFIEIPDFFSPGSERHWKLVEHIWYFTIDQFRDLLIKIGFLVVRVWKPVETKVVFQVEKPKQNRVSILLPPGIGDVYWELTKLRSFLERKGLGIPDVSIASRRDDSYNACDRAFPLLEMVPFIHSSGETKSISGKMYRPLWKEAYCRCGKTVFENVAGCDYFMSHNGYMGEGVSLEKSDSLECDWDVPLFRSLEQERFRAEARSNWGKYIVFYFVFQGTYRHWVEEFSVRNVIESIKSVAERSGCTPVLVGAPWDADHRTLRYLKRNVECVDLIGKTTLEQVFGLIRGAEMVVGFPSGLTIMSTVLKQKTMIIWNDYYNPDFQWNACPPETKNKTYFIENTNGLSVQGLTDSCLEVLQGSVPVFLLSRSREPEREFSESRTVVCVLKSGGDFTVNYVKRLRNMVERNTTVPYDFVCLTDLDIDPGICKSVKLERDLPGWWSKIELFRSGLTEAECLVYFDLDTVILGNIDELLLKAHRFSGLRPWNRVNREAGLFASGIMGWKNGATFSFMFEEFERSMIKEFERGDQEYFSEALADHGEKVEPIQSWMKGIYSYKRNCKRRPPANSRIICFHGKPRPHEVPRNWVKENWR